MEPILRLTGINYSYSSLLEQRRASALAMLIRLAVGLAIAILVTLLLTWTGSQGNIAILLMAPVLVITAMASLYFGNRGQLLLASWIYAGLSMLAALTLVGITGLGTSALLALAIPYFVAGLVLSQRDTLIVTGGLLGGLLVVGVLEVAVLQRTEGGLIDFILQPSLLLVFFGIMEWFLLGQVRESFAQISSMERSLSGGYVISDILGEADSMDNALREYAIRVQRHMELNQVQIFLVDESRPGQLRLRAAAGLAAQRALLDDRTVSMASDQLVATAAKSREPEVARSTDLASLRTGFFAGTHAELAIPLMDGPRLQGVIDLQSAFVDAFSLQEVETNMLISRQLELVLRNLRLAAQLDQAGADQSQLQRHIAQLSSEVQRLRSQASGTVWEEFFRNRERRALGFDLAREDPEPSAAQKLSSAMQLALETGQTQVEAVGEGHRLTIPIALRGEVLGAMQFDFERPGVLPERLIELASTVAERLSLSLDNARLVEQAQALAYREQQVSNISGRLQSTNTMEELVTLAAAEFSEAMEGALTHIRMQLRESPQAAPAGSPAAGQHEGGVA